MSDPASNAINLTGSIVGAGIGLAALGMTLNFVDEMANHSFTGNRPRKKSSGINDHDLMFGYGGGGTGKKKRKQHNDIFDFGDMNF
jgi:hypothetical protein